MSGGGCTPPPNCSQHLSTMNFRSLLESGFISESDCDEKVLIIDVTPELAEELLSYNFDDNRTASVDYIKRLSADMSSGLWQISNDAICVDRDGRMINGQHRLNAVKRSGTTQRFVFLWDLAPEAAQLIDVGKKRTMHERITISGTKITVKECAVIRHAMSDYSRSGVGTVQFGYTRHDDIVKQYYLKHSEFLQAMNAKAMQGAAFVKSAALKMYVEMRHYSHKYDFKHDMNPYERSLLFIDLVEDGFSKRGYPTGIHEHSAIKLKNVKDRRRGETKGQFWADKDAFQATVSMAFKFMTGETVQNLVRYQKDPFSSFLEAPATNTGGSEYA